VGRSPLINPRKTKEKDKNLKKQRPLRKKEPSSVGHCPLITPQKAKEQTAYGVR